MSLQKREVAKDDRAQEGSITLDRKTRKRSRVIALYGEVYRCHMQQNKENAAARTEKGGGIFFTVCLQAILQMRLLFPLRLL